MSITVTAAETGSTFGGGLLRVWVLTGTASSQAGAATATFGGTGAQEASITTTVTGSFVYGALKTSSTTSLTAASGTTLDDNLVDNQNGEILGSCHTTSATGTPGATTVGASAPSVGGQTALLEILPSGTITVDGSSPAVVSSVSASWVNLTTAAFTPPAGSLVLAIVSADASSSTVVTVSSTGGLSWTQQGHSRAGGGATGYAGVWTAQVPAAATGGQEALPAPVVPGLYTTPAAAFPQPQQGDPQWSGPAPFPPGAEALPPVNPPGLISPASWSDQPSPQPQPFGPMADPDWDGPAPFPPGAEAQAPLIPPGLYTTPAAAFPRPQQGDPSFSPLVPRVFPWLSDAVPGLAEPGWSTPANPDATFTTASAVGSGAQYPANPPGLTSPAAWLDMPPAAASPFGPMADPSWNGPAPAASSGVPQFLDQAGYRPRSAPRVSRGSYQPSLPQAGQGVQFPLQVQQAQRARFTLRRSQGRFFNPGQWNETAPQLPSFPSQAASARRIARTVRPARGQFFQQAWGQGNQGAQFPLYLQQPARKRLTLRRSEGQFFSPGQFNLTAPQLPGFTRQPQPARLTLRRAQGRFFNQAWGQANQGAVFPYPGFSRQPEARRLHLRRSQGTFFQQAWGQAGQGVTFPLQLRQPAPRLTLRRSRGTFFNQAWGQAPQIAAITSGAEQYPQITPPFTSPASWWQPWVPPADPGIQAAPSQAPAVPPQFISRQQRPAPARIPRGRSWGPGQFNLDGNPWPSFTRAASRPVPERAPRGKFASPGQWNLTAPQLPGFTRPAAAPPRLTLRRSQGKWFSPGQFSETANPSLPRVTRTSKRDLIWSRRGRFFQPVMPQAVIPQYPPDFRATRRFSFTRLDALRRGRTVQLVPAASAVAVRFQAGEPCISWAAGTPYTGWSEGEPYTGWSAGEPYGD